MAYPDPRYTKELQQRYHDFSDSGKKPFSALQLALLERDFDYFLRDAGIPLGKDRKIPETEGVPRIFVLGLDGDGREKPMTPQEAGIDMSPKSPEFWKQVSMGNVFAYPAGSGSPVQLRAGDDPDSYDGDFGYTRPVEPEKLPARQMKRPGLIARVLHRLSGGRWFREVDTYRKLQDAAPLREALSEMNSRRADGAADELEMAQEARRVAQARKEEAALKAELAEARESENEFQKCYENLRSVYKPIPELRDSLLKNGSREGLYTKEHFDDLKRIEKDELDLDRISIGPEGQPGQAASEKDFCAVAMFAGMKYENAEGAVNKEQFTDPHAVDSFRKNLGLSEPQARQLFTDGFSNLFTSDLFHIRDNSGGFFKVGVNNAREDAARAFNAYKNNDKEPLAKLIAFGIGRTAAETVNVTGTPGLTTKGIFRMGAQLVSLMEKDPKLKELACKNGLTDKQLKTVEATAEYLKLDDARKAARVKLLEAGAGERKLTAEEKRACAEAILKPTLVENIWVKENKDKNAELLEAKAKMDRQEPIPKELKDAWKKNPASRPAPPEGKFWADTGQTYAELVKQRHKPVPPVIASLKDQTDLDKIAKRIAGEDLVETKSCGELAGLYSDNVGVLLIQRITAIAGELKAEKEGPGALREGRAPEGRAEEPDLEQNLNINELIQGKQGGPRL